MPATPPPPDTAARITLTLGLDETNLVLEALGQLPFARVYQLIAAIQDQAHKQLANQPADGGTPA
ncbi:hypothetical protein [Streptomyces shenzhenensis]|uniref:Uncharacterized protein n=1 Tax=Streptomyces sp. R39 TaxID=3238631 RepID=A0AB39QZ71_9ACTN|nr:hypothetical protein [Streptomyces shenzhenensis]